MLIHVLNSKMRNEHFDLNEKYKEKNYWKMEQTTIFFPDCTVWHINKQSRKINGLCCSLVLYECDGAMGP